MSIFRLLLTLLLGVCASYSVAEIAPPKPWKGSAELSFVNANGNTKSSTFSNKDRFEYAKGPALLELEAGALRGLAGDLIRAVFRLGEARLQVVRPRLRVRTATLG